MAIYQVETDQGTYQVETEDPKSLEGFGNNALSDLKENAAGLVDQAGLGAKIASGDIAGALPDLVKKGQEFWSHPKDSAEAMVRPITHPIDYAYEHPVSQAVNVASVAAPMLEGAAETGAKYAGRFGEDQMGRLHGTSQAQFRQLGRENFGDVMRSSFEHGDADFGVGSIGREQAIKERIAQLGNDIGDVRGMAAEAPGAPMSGKDMADAIRNKIGSEYAPGGPKAEDAALFEKQLKNIEDMPNPTIQDFAQRSTDINTKAKGQKLIRSVDSDTDVADQMSHINDEQIAKRLPPEITEHYQMLKEEFGNTKPLDPMELRGEAKEALGKSPDTAVGLAKEALHKTILGAKTGAHVGFGLEGGLGAMAANAKAIGTAGVTSAIMTALQTDPTKLGKYAAPLSQAAQQGGQQGIAAMHFVLSSQFPEYQKLWNQ